MPSRASVSAKGSYQALPMLFGAGAFGFAIKGESYCQVVLEHLAGGRTTESASVRCIAILRPEPSNPHDRNAVNVAIRRERVGYIGMEHSADTCRRMRALGVPNSVACGAA
jgi:hypothetical protein